MGWSKTVNQPHPDKYIICLAPHTSNWDFVIGLLYAQAEGLESNFLMKREWFFWPLGPIFRHLGGIPVWRSKHTSMTDNLADEAAKSTRFHLCVTPEGTRSLNPDWKKGFYYIALKASNPHFAIWCRLQQKAHSVHPNTDSDRQYRLRNARD